MNHRWGIRLCGLCVALATSLFLPSPTAAQVVSKAPRPLLDVQFDPSAHRLWGQLTLGPESPYGEFPGHVWLPAARFQAALDDTNSVNFPWRFPAGLDSGSTKITGLTVGGQELEWRPSANERECEPIAVPAAVSAGRWGMTFETQLPRRFGPFGWVGQETTLLGGWYPLWIAPSSECGCDGVLPDLRSVTVRVVSKQGGLLILGTTVRLVTAGQAVSVIADLSRPLLLAFRRDFSIVQAGEGPNRRIGIASGPWDSAAFQAMTQAVAQANLVVPTAEPLLLVQAPLREMMVIPFEGGLLVSDRLLRVAGLGPLRSRHLASLDWGLAVQAYLARGTTYADALVLGVLAQWLAPKTGSEAASLRTWFRRAEVLSVVDQVGTDPQTGFQQALFGMPNLPDELASVPWFGTQHPESPWVVAHQILLVLGEARVRLLLADQTGGLAGPMARLAKEMQDLAPGLLPQLKQRRKVDFSLGEVRDGTVEVRTEGSEGPWAIELAVPQSGSGPISAFCPAFPCPVQVPGLVADTDLLLDPGERMAQWTDQAVDPRRNDRNYQDLKWMIARASFSASSQDSLPFAQVELVVQPRYDLAHMAFMTLFLGPVRSGMQGGMRWGLGQKNRANARSMVLGLAPRLSLDSADTRVWTAGVVASWMYNSYLSRTNPFDGTLIYGYALPFVEGNSGSFGARFGGSATQLWGVTPDHILAARFSVDSALGHLPGHEEAYSGGVEGVRALQAQGTGRRHRLSVSAEYRWMAVRNLWQSLLGLAWLEGIQAVVFVDAALLADDMGQIFAHSAPVLGAGAGLRPHTQVLGFVPAVLSLDFAWLFPVGAISEGGPSFVLGFSQAF